MTALNGPEGRPPSALSTGGCRDEGRRCAKSSPHYHTAYRHDVSSDASESGAAHSANVCAKEVRGGEGLWHTSHDRSPQAHEFRCMGHFSPFSVSRRRLALLASRHPTRERSSKASARHVCFSASSCVSLLFILSHVPFRSWRAPLLSPLTTLLTPLHPRSAFRSNGGFSR